MSNGHSPDADARLHILREHARHQLLGFSLSLSEAEGVTSSTMISPDDGCSSNKAITSSAKAPSGAFTASP
jgi:hypothetical protein